MLPQPWADSVNIQQPLARQTRFRRMGTCSPLGLPGVVRRCFVGGSGAWRGVAAALEAGQAQVRTCLLPRPQVGLGMGMGQ